MSKILIRYAEIGLKGKNRQDFERQLAKNICHSLNLKPNQVKIEQKQLLLQIKSNLINQSIAKLKQIFGIAWFSPIEEVATDMKKINSLALRLVKNQKFNTFAIKATRTDKNLAFISQDIAIKVGDSVRKTTKTKVNLNNPDLTIYISAGKRKTLIFTQKISGPGGLPVGSSGKVLSLISGGFDSIISSYLLAKRGAQVDFLHFHVFSHEKKVLQSKINTIIKQLSQSTLSKKLFLASYTPFQMAVLDLKNRQARHELVVFRRLMVKIGEELAKQHGYQALVLGDSLGQVASQTMENIVAVDQAVNIPIFRPLIGMDKKDIIDLVKQLNLEKTTNLPYKDCCSIISTHPATRANLNKVKLLEEQINIKEVINEIINQTQIINL